MSKRGVHQAIPTPDEVKALRLARRQTVVAAAASIGVSRRTWFRWESGAVTPDPRAVRDYEHTVPIPDPPPDPGTALAEFLSSR